MACTCKTCDATPADVREVASQNPEIVALTDAEIEIYLMAARAIFADLGDCTCMIQALAAASLAFDDINGQGGVIAGPLTAEANGPASRSFGMLVQAGTADALWASNPYGKRVIVLRRACSKPAVIVGNTWIKQ